MRICIFTDCGGHDEKIDVVIHGQQHLAAEMREIKRIAHASNMKVGALMGIADDILAAENAEAAAVTALGGAVTEAVTELTEANAQIADLIANGSLSDEDKAALQSALDTANASTATLGNSLAEVNGALNPTPPADGE